MRACVCVLLRVRGNSSVVVVVVVCQQEYVRACVRARVPLHRVRSLCCCGVGLPKQESKLMCVRVRRVCVCGLPHIR